MLKKTLFLVLSLCLLTPVFCFASVKSAKTDNACAGVATPISAPPAATPPAVGCVIKGNISSKEKIYHLPGCRSYKQTIIDEKTGEKWFCVEDDAVKAGFRKAKNC